jgi:very-short-patch-repair endonuclease
MEVATRKMGRRRALDAGYRVQPQWPVGAYRIDLVAEGRTRRLAVECDGERWHTPEQLHRDLERQAMLERLGWVFVRIRGSIFFRDPDTAMVPVFSKLNDLGIEPLGVGGSQTRPDDSAPLVERIRRQAQMLRGRWSAEKMAADLNEDENDRRSGSARRRHGDFADR